jgi:hypothetical protein
VYHNETRGGVNDVMGGRKRWSGGQMAGGGEGG